MLRSFFILIFVLFSVPAFSSSFEYRDYGDSKCEMRTLNPNDLNLSLVAKMTDESFDEYKSEGTSNFENNMHTVKGQLSRASGQCLKFDGDKSSCHLILDKIGEWQEKQYLITQSPFDSANWWEEALQVAVFHHTMLETLSIASRQLNIEPSENIALSEWVNKSITKSSKVNLTKGNHRTAWFLAAAKAAEIFDRPIKVGFNMLSAEELIEEELEFQFNMQRADGSLPEETKRGRRAIFYTGREISLLIALMEMGENLGLESYKKYGNKLHLAIDFMLDAIDDPDKVYPYAKEMKASTKGDPRDQQYGSSRGAKAGTFGFANIYASRFPDHKNVRRMRENKNFIPFIEFDVKLYNAFGIDVGCLKPAVKIGTVDIDLSNSSKPKQTSRILKNCKFQITRKSGTNTRKLMLNRGELGIDANGSLIFGENDGYKLKTKKGQMKDLLQNSSNLKFANDRLSGDFSTYHGKDASNPELVSIDHLKPKANKFDGKYPFVYSSGADGELTIYICKDPE